MPTLLFANDINGIFFLFHWILLAYQNVFTIVTGIVIYILDKKNYHSLFPKILVYIFLILGILTGGTLLIFTIGLCLEPDFWVDFYLPTLGLQFLAILTGGFQIWRSRLYLKSLHSS
jgi:hypothetical protein